MRSLMIAPAMPALSGNGLAMRLGVFLEALRRLGAVDLAVLPLAGDAAAPATLPAALGVNVAVIPTAGRGDSHYSLVARLRDPQERLRAFRQFGRSSLAAQLSRAVIADVAAACGGRDYDLVHVGRAYLAEAGLAIPGARRRSLDVDEDDVAAWRSMATRRRRRGEFAAAALIEADADALEGEMSRALPRFDLLLASSAAEAASLRRFATHGEFAVALNAAVARPFPLRRDHGGPVVFVGGLGYWPNRDGLEWLLGRVWPRVVARSARAPSLWIVGGGAGAETHRLARRPGVRLLGAVADLGPIYRRAALALAPLHCGGGTRIKVIEAAMAGVPVAATRFGAAGLPLRHGRDLWLADRPEDLAEQIAAALADPAERARRAASARGRFASRYERSGVVERLACQLAALQLTNPAA